MPQSFAGLHYHVVFSTKGRAAMIAPDWRPRMYEYIGGILREKGGCLVSAGGTADHIHLLARLGRETRGGEGMRLVKTTSSRGVHECFPGTAVFAWQDGYGAFTVSFSQLPVVR